MRAFLISALIGLSACSFESEKGLTVENACGGDADCAQGVCDGRICVDDTGATVSVSIEVLRGSSESEGATPASWAFDVESFSGPSARDLVLPATRLVRGLVRWDGVPVPSTLRFVRRMAASVASLPPVPVEVDTVRNGDGGEEFDFSVALIAGETYDVTVLPSDDMISMPMEASAPAIRSLPPLYLELTVEDADLAEPFEFDVTFPSSLVAPCSNDIDVGCTLEAEVFSVDGELELPEAGLQVRAVDKGSGRVVSSIGETDASGRFAIRISQTAPDYFIRVTSTPGREPFPAVSIDPDLAFDGSPDEQRVYIPRLPQVQFTGRVIDGQGNAVPVATLRFLSTGIFDVEELGLQGSFAATASTDQDGAFEAVLLPGFYSVAVTPPEHDENNWGTLTAPAAVGEDLITADPFVVPSQIDLHGWVTTFSAEKVPGVTVFARARRSLSSEELHRSQEAVSNSLGAFEMSVDSGQYDMHVKVPSESGFAWVVEPELSMSVERGDLLRQYQLAPPVPVEGRVRNSVGDLVPGSLVRAYLFMRGEDGTRSIQVAETRSAEDGSYRLLIAPQLAAE